MRSGRRRLLGFIGGLVAAAAASPSFSQPVRRPYYRIGFLGGGDALRHEFAEGMRELGYEEGRHYSLVARDYGGERSKIAGLADELAAIAGLRATDRHAVEFGFHR